jgi:hypothetical protein
MEAKDKAKELIDKFKKETSYEYQEYAGAHYSIFEHDIGTIKQCALLCVEEILQDGMLEKAPFMNNGKDLMESNYVRYKDYWHQVKTEIKNYGTNK